MSQIQALLSILAKNGGDELILEAESAPQFLQRGRPLKLFLRAMSKDRHQELVDELVDPEQRATLEAQRQLGLEHDGGDAGPFAVQLRGPAGERIRLVKREEAAAIGDPSEPDSPPASPAAEVQAPEPSSPATPRPPDHPGEPAPELVQLLSYAAERKASDLHLATGEPATLRIDGRLAPVGEHAQDPESLLGGLLGPADRQALSEGRSVDRAVQLPHGARFRMNLYRCATGLGAAFRVLRPAAPPLKRLRLPVDLSWITRLSHGLVLFCGPTGSGKSTTMAALCRSYLEARGGLLITLEDPIEYTFEAPRGALVRQRELDRHVADFPTGLRDALREDPDVLLVGEMRDPESIQLALTAAETGHLVLASLHSRSAPAAVERIVDAYPPERQRQIRVQLADALRGVVSQRLLPKVGGGRTPAVEILKVNHAASALIRDGKTPQLISVIQTSAGEGMIPMDRCIRELVDAGRVSPADGEAAVRA